jgi:hypothetical protein
LGELIVTERLDALGNRPLTDFHSWNDTDEMNAGEIAETFCRSGKVSPRADISATHLLAGATMAAYADPDAFERINHLLNCALDELVAGDQRLQWPVGI